MGPEISGNGWRFQEIDRISLQISPQNFQYKQWENWEGLRDKDSIQCPALFYQLSLSGSIVVWQINVCYYPGPAVSVLLLYCALFSSDTISTAAAWAWLTLAGLDLYISQSCAVKSVVYSTRRRAPSPLSLSLSLSLLHSQSVTTIFIIQPSIAPHQLPGQAWIMSTGKLVHHSFLSLLYISSFIEIFNCGVWEARKCWINSTQVRRLSCFSTFITVPYLCPRHYLSKTGLTTNNII